MKIVKIPEIFDHRSFDTILNQEKDIIKESKIDPKGLLFDASDTKYISIQGLLLLLSIRDSLDKDCKCRIAYGQPKDKSTVASLMEVMGVVEREMSKQAEEYWDGYRVPVQRSYNGNQNMIAVNGVMRVIKKEFNPPEPILNALNWALWELVDNAGMHGYGISEFGQNYPKPLYFCAFDYKDIIDIAILDVGQGIQTSFLSSGIRKYQNITNEEALLLAIQNAESSKPSGSMGFGLFGCTEIARYSKGELVIISGSNKLLVSKSGTKVESCSKFLGTMVSLSVPRDAVINLREIFGEKSLVLDSIADLFGI